MRLLDSLTPVGVRAWSLGRLVGRIEATGRPWRLQQLPSGMILGVGDPVQLDGPSVRGPGFVSSAFFAAGALDVSWYPLVAVVRGSETRLFEAGPTARALVVELDSAPAEPTGDRLRVEEWPVVPEEVCDAVVRAQQAIADGRVDKLVVAARVAVPSASRPSRAGMLDGLSRAHPASMLYASDEWCGASPELVVAKEGRHVRLRPLAGTAPRARASELLRSAKDLVEHQLLVDQLLEDLAPLVERLDRPAPELVDVGELVHLGTALTGRLQRGVSLAELAAAIAPTAAVSGVPRKEALVLLAEREPWRGRYGGLVGLVDHAGDGALYLAIRGIDFVGDRAEVTAGAGVVRASDPERERVEIQAKIDAVLRAVSA